MSALLIIGGSGFFGKSILDAYKRGLLRAWEIEKISIMARSASKLKIEYPELVSESIQLIDADISICGDLPYADYVIHAAASTDASKYLLAPEKERENILSATQNYCKLAKKYHQKSKIVYISSGAVYGPQNGEVLEISEDESIELSLGKMPLNKIGYASAKRDSEKLIKRLGMAGLNVSIARCFAFVGKYLPLDQHFAIGNFIWDGLRGSEIRVSARKKVFRSYLYADDLVEWLLSLVSIASKDCPIINVGSDEAIRIDLLASIIANKFNTTVAGYECIDKEIDRYIPSIQKARRLGMMVRWDLNAALESTIAQLKILRTRT